MFFINCVKKFRSRLVKRKQAIESCGEVDISSEKEISDLETSEMWEHQPHETIITSFLNEVRIKDKSRVFLRENSTTFISLSGSACPIATKYQLFSTYG